MDSFSAIERNQATMVSPEGVFLACSFWMVDALLGVGRRTEAVALFEKLLAVRNDVGLLSEEWSPREHRQLGKRPQAYNHFSLIITALQLEASNPTVAPD